MICHRLMAAHVASNPGKTPREEILDESITGCIGSPCVQWEWVNRRNKHLRGFGFCLEAETTDEDGRTDGFRDPGGKKDTKCKRST